MMTKRMRAAETLMAGFAERTGLSEQGTNGPRYLWTDALAVFSFLALYRRLEKKEHLATALHLVERVHTCLGRHRNDDPRTGWISGLGESEGKRHPRLGGLRIGKPLNERGPDEPFDDQLEWQRDGQYFHYLTKWMHALHRVTLVTGDWRYNDWALELAAAAHRGFVYESPHGDKRMHWKMSIDLSRPLVASMGQLDPLDGFVVCSRLQATRSACEQPQGPDLRGAQSELYRMCEGATWASTDELGIGGLLVEAGQLIQLIAEGHSEHRAILDDVLADAQQSLRFLETHNRLGQSAETRLAFRELGLVLGLRALNPMRDSILRYPEQFSDSSSLLARIESMARYSPMIEHIQRFWLEPNNQGVSTWMEHLEINSVTLATSLVPEVYLMSGPGLL